MTVQAFYSCRGMVEVTLGLSKFEYEYRKRLRYYKEDHSELLATVSSEFAIPWISSDKEKLGSKGPENEQQTLCDLNQASGGCLNILQTAQSNLKTKTRC